MRHPKKAKPSVAITTETKKKDEDYDELGELANYMISEMSGRKTSLKEAVGSTESEECPECEEVFPDLKALSEHFEAMHEEEGSEEEDVIPHQIQPKLVKQSNTSIAPKVGHELRRNSFPLAASNTKTGSRMSVGESNVSGGINKNPQAVGAKKPPAKVQTNASRKVNKVQKIMQASSAVSNSAASPKVGGLRKESAIRSPRIGSNPSTVKLLKDMGINVTKQSEFSKSASVVMKSTKLTIKYLTESEVPLMKDVRTAKVPGPSRDGDSYLNSFLAFFHQKETGATLFKEPKTVETQIYLKDNPLTKVDTHKSDVNNDDVITLEEDESEDLLMKHIREMKLPLVRRRPTLSDGNCWYDALADQVELHEIPDKPAEHGRLRTEVCRALPNLPQTPQWIENIFENSKLNFSKFLSRHARPGTWTDENGIMCQATALYLERNVHIVGTINAGHPQTFTKLESVAGAQAHPPLYVGYYQDQHYQSLQWVGEQQQGREEAGQGLEQQQEKMREEPAADPERDSAIAEILVEMVAEAVVQAAVRLAEINLVKAQERGAGIIRESEETKLAKKNREKKEAEIDKMIEMIEKKIGKTPEVGRLEIFGNLSRVETILEFNMSAAGKCIKPFSKSDFVKPLPLQLTMGEVIIPTKYREEAEAESKASAAAAATAEPANKSQLPDVAVVEQEEAPVILSVYKCKKCNHAFEKINLFVKHFISTHKDFIDANKDNKSFSFSSFWQKMKVKAKAKKKPSNDVEILEPEKELSKPKVPAETSPIDLMMKIEIEKGTLKESKKKKKPSTLASKINQTGNEKAFADSNYLDEFFTARDSGITVFDIEEVLEETSSVEVALMDKYQVIPLSEIKVENPFELLPFDYETEKNLLNEEIVEESLAPVTVIDIEGEESILGVPDSEGKMITQYILSSVLEDVCSPICPDIIEDIEEIFDEQFHDLIEDTISHQVYIKDFDWIPLEYKFRDIPEAKVLFEIKNIKCEQERRKEISKLFVESASEDVERMKEFVKEIISEGSLPEEADHSQEIEAATRNTQADHDYFVDTKRRKRTKPVPGNIIKQLSKMGSKVNIFPAPVYSLDRKPSFQGKKPEPLKVNEDILIKLNKNKATVTDEKKDAKSKPCVIGRSKIEVIPVGSGVMAEHKFLDKYLKDLQVPPARDNMPSEENVSNSEPVIEEDESLFDKKQKETKTVKEEEKVSKEIMIQNIVKHTEDNLRADIVSNSKRKVEADDGSNKSKKKLKQTETQGTQGKKRKRKHLLENQEDNEMRKQSRTEDVNLVRHNNISEPNPVDESYDVQLQKHLDSMREVPEPELQIDSSAAPPQIPTAQPPGPPAACPPPGPPAACPPPGPPGPPPGAAPVGVEAASAVEEGRGNGYSIKQEPIDMLALACDKNEYNIKLETIESGSQVSSSIAVKKESSMTIDFSQENSFWMKNTEIKTEPALLNETAVNEANDDNDIQILEPTFREGRDEVLDVLENISRCEICFKSFNSAADLLIHLPQHAATLSKEKDAGNVIEMKTRMKMSQSKYPQIFLKRVTEPVNKDRQEKTMQTTQGGNIPKITTLQALDNLLGGSFGLTKVINKAEQTKKVPTSLPDKSEGILQSTCPVCQKVFPTMETLRKHLSYHPHTLCLNKVNICYICDEKFDLSDKEYSAHVEDHLNGMRKPSNLKCFGCFREFNQTEILMNHVSDVHKKKRSFPCPVCQTSYDRKRQLINHITSMHEELFKENLQNELF